MRFVSHLWKFLVPVVILAAVVSGDALPKSHIRIMDVAPKRITVEFMLPVEFGLNQVSGPDVMKGDVLACKTKSGIKDTLTDGTKLTVVTLECGDRVFTIREILLAQE